jgi:hypothetical protein
VEELMSEGRAVERAEFLRELTLRTLRR